MITYEGKLVHTKVGWCVVTNLTTLPTLSVHPDYLDEFSPNLTNTIYWNNRTIRFEIKKKFLENETHYFAKIIHQNPTISWAQVFEEYIEYSLTNSKLFSEWVVENFKPPIRK